MGRFARLLAALVVVISVPVGVAAADDTGWVINSFQADISVHPDSTLLIVETITVDFKGLQKHGIFREIPVRYDYDQKRYRVFRLEVLGVTNGSGGSWPFEKSENGAYSEIKIGDPDHTVTGRQTYVIRYTVGGALNGFEDHDELYWNVNGSRWPVATESTSAVVHLPPGSFQRATCYQGTQGSTQACEQAAAGDAVTYSAGRLEPGGQLTIVAAMSKGAVAAPRPILEQRPRGFPEYFEAAPQNLGVALGVLLLGLLLLALTWWRHGRDQVSLDAHYRESRGVVSRLFPGRDPVIAQFEPPDGLRPAEVGTLLDERADTKDVTATIVDLAGRGFLRIEQVAHNDWKLSSMAPSKRLEELKPYERSLLECLFRGTSSVTLSSLRGHFSSELEDVEDLLYRDATETRWFSRDPRLARWRQVGLGVGIVLVGLLAALGLGAAAGWGLPGAAIALVGLAWVAGSRYMSRRTPKGSQLLQQALGLRLYMRTAERYRQQFAEKENLFTAFLPYAIVFGCVERWARAFEGLDAQPSQTAWYGAGGWQALALSESLESFNSNLGATLSESPPSSSGSGFSGGFSGGGGGGGGGGSW